MLMCYTAGTCTCKMLTQQVPLCAQIDDFDDSHLWLVRFLFGVSKLSLVWLFVQVCASIGVINPMGSQCNSQHGQ